MNIQKLKKEEEDKYSIAERYYAILSAINSLSLTQREIQLISFMAINGSVSYKHFREEFCKKYSTSSPTTNNMISKLKKINVLIKDNGKIKINPILILDFTSDIKLEITLLNGQTKEY